MRRLPGMRTRTSQGSARSHLLNEIVSWQKLYQRYFKVKTCNVSSSSHSTFNVVLSDYSSLLANLGSKAVWKHKEVIRQKLLYHVANDSHWGWYQGIVDFFELRWNRESRTLSKIREHPPTECRPHVRIFPSLKKKVCVSRKKQYVNIWYLSQIKQKANATFD